MSSYIIVIPSFKRESIILTHTLKALSLTDIKAPIFVFTANEEETEKYKKVLPKEITIVTGVRGIPNQRNFIQKYFKEGTRLLFIDDDIKDIIGLNISGKRIKATHMNHFIETAFNMVQEHGMLMWGINSTYSNLEMKHKVSIGRIYLVGNFYGLINSHSILVDEGENIITRRDFKAGKESHERALLMYKHFGGVMKFRSFGVVSKYWGVPGGHQISRTAEGEEEAARYLNNLFPEETRLRFYKEVWDLVIRPSTSVMNISFIQPSKDDKFVFNEVSK